MPLVLCEYTHAMGNSNGGLKEYWDLFYSGTNAQGAFVWDWVDQGLWQPVPEEHQARTGRTRFLAYGGWFEDRVGVRNDNNFCMNGVVAGDRTPHPSAWAFKYVYRYVHAAPVDLARGTIRVKNWHDFVNAADVVDGRWEVKADGRTIASGALPALDLAPRAGEDVHDRAAGRHGGARRGVLAERELRAEGGHAVGEEGLRGGVGSVRPAVEGGAGSRGRSLQASSTWSMTRAWSGSAATDWALTFDKVTGGIASYFYKGTRLIERGPRPDFWRAPTDNDIGAWKSILGFGGAAGRASFDAGPWRPAAARGRLDRRRSSGSMRRRRS